MKPPGVQPIPGGRPQAPGGRPRQPDGGKSSYLEAINPRCDQPTRFK
jgi:hypothetical protein